MDIFLLGNGFDLYHKLPTRYDNFLHTINYLIDNYTSSIDTVGKVFGDTSLQKEDYFIKECYEEYRSIYNNVYITHQEISALIKIAKENLWFKYFSQSFNKELGWIDFEQEISKVLDAFKELFRQVDDNTLKFFLSSMTLKPEYEYILGFFDFFYKLSVVEGFVSKEPYIEILSEYILEQPYGSKNYIYSKQKIIQYLYNSLEELACILKEYLNIFIDRPLSQLSTPSQHIQHYSFSTADYIITFNYTNTYEILYKKEKQSIVHIHGNIKEKIVLGINPNADDFLQDMDTSFIQFKKYFQRVVYNTDYYFYLNEAFLSEISKNHTLHIIGHSLDITDEDIIKKVFASAQKIVIYYHTQNVIGLYMTNLIKIYGKDGFDRLREEKLIEFKPLN